MFHFGMTTLCIISGCISLTQQRFVHYLCLASFFQKNTLSRAGFSLLFQIQRPNSKHEDVMLILKLLECLY